MAEKVQAFYAEDSPATGYCKHELFLEKYQSPFFTFLFYVLTFHSCPFRWAPSTFKDDHSIQAKYDCRGI